MQNVYIKLESQIIDRDLDCSGHWIDFSHSVKNDIYRRLKQWHCVSTHLSCNGSSTYDANLPDAINGEEIPEYIEVLSQQRL